MKKLAAYYLLLLYTASVCKPVAIWFADVMAHSYFSHQHAAVVHHQEGRDHVHYQVGKAAKDDAPEQKATTPKTGDELTTSSFTQSLLRADCFLAEKVYPFSKTSLPSLFLSPQPMPPWA